MKCNYWFGHNIIIGKMNLHIDWQNFISFLLFISLIHRYPKNFVTFSFVMKSNIIFHVELKSYQILFSYNIDNIIFYVLLIISYFNDNWITSFYSFNIKYMSQEFNDGLNFLSNQWTIKFGEKRIYIFISMAHHEKWHF